MANINKEVLKKTSETSGRMSFGTKYEENNRSKMKGEFFLILNHNDGKVEKYYQNVIVDSASLLIARLLADGQTTLDPVGPAHGIWVLAVGTGHSSWDPQNPPVATTTQTKLEAELARKRFANVNFVKTDGSGLPATEITNIIDFQTVFSESEAVGPIMELGLYGGDAEENVIDEAKDNLINYRTIQVINKPNTATLSVIFRLTM